MSKAKGSKHELFRKSRPYKRSFYGNQFSQQQDSEPAEQCTSAKKLKNGSTNNVQCNPLHGYRIIEFFSLFAALSEVIVCRQCKSNVQFDETGNRGLGFKLTLLCECGSKHINSGPLIHTGYEVNRRIVFIMRLLGVGREGLNVFCNMMDISDGLSESSYTKIVEHIYSATKSVFEFCCKKAVEEETNENIKQERPIVSLKVSGDGSWRKRGFKSLYGVTTLIGYYSGKVIDLVVKSSYCQGCTFWKNKTHTDKYREWYEEHKEECAKNHEGSAGKMEVDAILEMFLRSEEKFHVKYSNYVGDGDSKTFKAILDTKPYGDEFNVTKSECISHVQKRMGTRLRNAKKANKLGGKGKLTDGLIKDLTKYYDLAIRRNVNSIEDMKKAIMATYYHKCSTDANPRHDYCPTGTDSWCAWQKSQATGKNMRLFKHPEPLHTEVKKHILPIYEDLSKEALLERCLGGHTQNQNESFNSTIWRFAPKHLHSGVKILEISAYIAAGLFNEGYSSILKTMHELDIIVGKQTKQFTNNIDARRVLRQERRSLSETKDARVARRNQLLEQQAFFEDSEGLLYGPGIAD